MLLDAKAAVFSLCRSLFLIETQTGDEVNEMAKIKMKSHRGAAKRFRVTAKGRVKFRAANRSHNFLGDNGKTKRSRRSPKPLLCKSNAKVIKELLLAN